MVRLVVRGYRSLSGWAESGSRGGRSPTIELVPMVAAVSGIRRLRTFSEIGARQLRLRYAAIAPLFDGCA